MARCIRAMRSTTGAPATEPGAAPLDLTSILTHVARRSQLVKPRPVRNIPWTMGANSFGSGAGNTERADDARHRAAGQADGTATGDRAATAGGALGEARRWLAVEPAAQGLLEVTTDRGPRSYLLGPRTRVEGEVAMLDWRSAPLAEAF